MKLGGWLVPLSTYPVIALDSTEYKAHDLVLGSAALGVEVGATTIPQVFVGGTLVGGCNETMQACKDGKLQQMLVRAGVGFDESVRDDPFSFLPNWRGRN